MQVSICLRALWPWIYTEVNDQKHEAKRGRQRVKVREERVLSCLESTGLEFQREVVVWFDRSQRHYASSAIRNWPPVETLKRLQEFPGTCKYMSCHEGPAHACTADPLRLLLRPWGRIPAE